MVIFRSLVLPLLVAVQCFAVPLSFEQRNPNQFLSRFANGKVEVLHDRIILQDVTVRFVGASGAARLEGLGPSAPSTYLRAGFVKTFPQFPKLAIHELYPGVDAVFYGNGENLEYDLKIAGGVSSDRIRISLDGARKVRIDDNGNLTIETASGVLQQLRPHVFQGNHEIAARYIWLTVNEIGIRLGKYNRQLPLTIDPVLAYVKYFGGSGTTRASVIALDTQGNIYVAGQSNSVDFPATSNALEPNVAPPLQVITNAGQTIKPLRIDSVGTVTLVSGTPDGRILYAATSNGIFVSGDSGATWRQTSPLPVPGGTNSPRSATVNNIAIDPLDPATVLVATNVGVFGTQDAGQFWGAHDTGLPVSGNGFVSVASVFYNLTNPLIAYAVTSNPSYLAVTSDAGGSWRELNPTYPGEPPAPTIPFPALAATLSTDGNTLFAVNGNGTLLKSTDGGTSWVKLAQGLVGPIAIKPDPSNGNTLYVLTQAGLQKSVDGGATFSKLATPLPPKTFAVDSSGALYVGGIDFSAAGVNVFSISTDGGKTFVSLPGLTNFQATTLSAVDGSVFAGSTSPTVPFIVKLDPSGSSVLYSTFLGGSVGDGISGVAIDSHGNAVLVGSMGALDIPLTVPASIAPSPTKPNGFVAKLSADGTHLIYALGLGASQASSVQAVALDASDAVYITGQTRAADFPTTAGAFQPKLPATACSRPQANLPIQPVNSGSYVFVSKLNADGGSLAYSTYLTGSCGSASQSIAVDAAGEAVVAGATTSPDFPVSSGSYQPAFPGDATQVSPPATFDAGFVTKLSPAGDKLVASTYLGGGYASQVSSVAVDAAGAAYVTGSTQGFPLGATPGAFQTKLVDRCVPTISIGPSLPNTGTPDAFVLELDPTFSTPRFLTYLGGSCFDSVSHLAVDPAGNIWVTGITQSPDFPLKDLFQGGGIGGGFVSELNPDGSQLLFSSFTEGSALAVTSSAAYLAGASGNLAFVAKIDSSATPPISIDSVGPVVSFQPTAVLSSIGGVAPGLIVQITGRNLGPATKVNAQLDALGRLPYVVANTTVFFDNIPAPLLSVQANSIQCFAPFELGATTEISVLSNGQRSNAVRTGVAPSAPQILTILNQDGSINSADHPAKAGSVIVLYVSGLGETTPLSVDGLVNSAPFTVPQTPVTIHTTTGTPVFQSTPDAVVAAPGLIAGITQVNVRLLASAGTTAQSAGIGVNSASATVYVTP